MKRIILVGGGPSSALCAYQIKKKHPDYEVNIFESDDQILKRILISGNGRANFFNNAFLEGKAFKAFNNPEAFNRFIDPQAARKLISLLSNDFEFSYYRDEEGRMYPFSNTSASLRDALLKGLRKVGVNIFLNSSVKSIDSKNHTVLVNGKTQEYDYLVLGIGGYAYDRKPDSNSSLLSNLNIKINNDFQPALCPLKTNESIPSPMDGMRLKGTLSLYRLNQKLYSEEGEILFKKDGISGICVFDASLFINDALNGYRITFDPFEHDGFKVSFNGASKSLDDLVGIFPHSFIQALKEKGLKKAGEKEIREALTFNIHSKYPLKYAQISLGGVLPQCLDNNFSLTSSPEIKVLGEAIDIHAICGGFNMGFALLSGMIAGDSVD
ncbi:MAG: NAD(P)/FAD-dependent oxidoreductase [Bacilli bacterium]|jgi:predicted Rossmann fold flavoprotein|nr:NAD(P)/FAD-dependent oxidoreductase [Bacilli bacterium]